MPPRSGPRRRKQPSKVDLLPPPLREAVEKLWAANRYTLEELAGFLADLSSGKRSMLPPELDLAVSIDPDKVPSKSGIGRHVKAQDAIGERLKQSRQVADALVDKLGDAPESRIARLNIELMQGVVLNAIVAAEAAENDGGGWDADASAMRLDPEQTALLARTLKDLAAAKKTDADLILRLRKEMAAEMARELAEKARGVEKIGREAGLSGETLAQMREQLVGVRPSS